MQKYFIADKVIFEDGNKFIRKGIVGDWKNYFLEVQNAQFDMEINAKLEANDIKYQYEIP